ncbi:MAG TPA: hypothetical protein VHT30_06490 [Acidimicrobiales bacterium]|jgi:hypothetical protein|nr:hypothetical protein [Acidimicrobiales bacterium]
MTSVVVTPLEHNRYGVKITEGDITTGHRVSVPPELLDDLGIVDADPVEVVRQAIGFLLDREPATAIWEHFPLDQIAQHYPDFYDELLTRLAA